MPPELLATLSDFSTGALSVLATAFVVWLFIRTLDKRNEQFTAQLLEREIAMRELEREVRTSITSQLHEATKQQAEVSRLMERVITYLDKS